MKKQSLLLALLATGVLWGGAQAVTRGSVGPGHGIVAPHPMDSNPCEDPILLRNDDGSFENGYSWYYGGVLAPYYGAFAEGYHNTNPYYVFCAVELELTTLMGYYADQSLDVYVWDSGGGNPGSVLSVTAGAHITPPAIWPDISTHDIDVSITGCPGDFFAGYWGNWPGQLPGWFVAADLNGPGGLPRTNIAPGIGYPTGWNDPSVIWGPTQALGIRAILVDWPCKPGERCGDQLGACCLADGSCGASYEQDCPGIWMGGPCDPNPCPTSSVGGASWAASSRRLDVAPNPGRGPFAIGFRLAQETPVTLEVFNASGALVRRVEVGPQAGGLHVLSWDGRDGHGNGLPSGVYLLRIQTPAGVISGKATLSK